MYRIPRLRRAYGPREQRGYVDDATQIAARDLPEWCESRLKAITMPRGGVRYVVACPGCESMVAYLYRVSCFELLRCRQCCGWRYRSQYAGRRIEASPDRLDWARGRLDTADGKIAPDRLDRLCAASDRWCARIDRYIPRRECDFAFTLLRIIARIERHQAHLARRRAYMWLYRRGWRAADQPYLLPPAQPSDETLSAIAACRAIGAA